METKYTPSPWRYSEAHNDIISMSNCKDDIICDVKGSKSPHVFVNKKNAYLIAAAPELLEILEKIMCFVYAESQEESAIIDEAKVIISRAKRQ